MTDQALSPRAHIAHHLRRRLNAAGASHVVLRVGKVKLRAVHLKAGFAYGGAVMMGLDFALACCGPVCFPHTYMALEPLVTLVCSKGGAFLAGAAVFFDRIMEW